MSVPGKECQEFVVGAGEGVVGGWGMGSRGGLVQKVGQDL